MHKLLASALLFTSAIATPAFAQDQDVDTPEDRPFSGFYIGGSVGATLQTDNDNETILFDRDLNGSFGDTVTTSAGANAFSTGFCGGTVSRSAARPSSGCASNSGDIEFAGRVGFDFDMGGLVVGVVGEVGDSDASSSVTAFSTTPASYTITRQVELLANLRARVGTTLTPNTLVYGTAGVAYTELENSFETTNAVNSVTTSNDSEDALGFVLGAGAEQMIGTNLSVGLEYLYHRFEANDFRVRLGPGTAPASNPFLLGNPQGTDFVRSSDQFDLHSVRGVLNLRF